MADVVLFGHSHHAEIVKDEKNGTFSSDKQAKNGNQNDVAGSQKSGFTGIGTKSNTSLLK